jgi:hypothetical protein
MPVENLLDNDDGQTFEHLHHHHRHFEYRVDDAVLTKVTRRCETFGPEFTARPSDTR